MKVDFFLSLSLMNLDALRARLHPRQALNGVIIRKIHFYFALRQCDQIGRFKISFWQKIITKADQIFGDSVGHFEKHQFDVKAATDYTLSNFCRKFGNLLLQHLVTLRHTLS